LLFAFSLLFFKKKLLAKSAQPYSKAYFEHNRQKLNAHHSKAISVKLKIYQLSLKWNVIIKFYDVKMLFKKRKLKICVADCQISEFSIIIGFCNSMPW